VHPSLRRELEAVVGADHVLTDPGLRATYETDWTRRWRGSALAVVRPGSTDEVAAVLRLLNEARVPVVPQGGNTGMVGGSVPRGGEVVLSLTRLREMEPVDEAGEVTVGAGATLTAVQEHVRPLGWDVGVDLGARDSATIGGMVASNAGGIRVVRNGTMRAQVRGLEAVLADGTILRRLPGMLKDNTGLHLPSLLAGSEGTLAVITRVRLALVPTLARAVVALAGIGSIGDAAALASRLRRRLPTLVAAEAFTAEGLDLVVHHAGLAAPFSVRHPAYLLVECAGAADPLPELADALEAEAAGMLADVAVGEDEATRRRLWLLRERLTESISGAGIPHKLDVGVPVARVGELAERAPQVVAEVAPGAWVVLYGHVLDGNLHINVLGLDPEDEAADDAVLRLAISLGGTISAEHGVGVAKTRWLEADRGAADVAAMRAVKRALDPRGILNPGVLLPPE
jgi:FAD/FMN-containing dehydrogenase